MSSAASDSPEGRSSSSSSSSARCSSSSTYAEVSSSENRLADLLAVALRGLLELGRVDLRPEDVAQPLAEASAARGLGASDT